MTESNNVRFVQDESKWVWKCYDANGSVTHRSQLFNSEKEARDDHELNGGQYKTSSSQPEAPNQEANVAPDITPQNEMSAGNVAPEGELAVGTAIPGAETTQPGQDAGMVA